MNVIGQRLWTGSESNPGGPLDEGESLTVNLQSLTDVSLRGSYFILKTDGNSERCGGSQKFLAPLLFGEVASGSHTSTCETTFRFTQSFWKCETRATFRFRVSLECLEDDGEWQPRHFTSGPIPDECDNCSNCF